MTHKPLTNNQIKSKCPKPAGKHPKHTQMILANPTTHRLTNPKLHTNNQTLICAPHKPKRVDKRGIYKNAVGRSAVIERRMSKAKAVEQGCAMETQSGTLVGGHGGDDDGMHEQWQREVRERELRDESELPLLFTDPSPPSDDNIDVQNLVPSGTKIKLPRYNKSANAGYGDRADPSQWPEVEGPVKVVLFEGWMLGFDPQEESAVTAVDPQLAAVNKKLKAYHDAWHSMVDSWVIIQVGDPNWVYEWRLQAEVAMRNDGRPGLTDEQVADFVSRYMPAYKAYLPSLYSHGPKGARQEHVLKLDINEDRNPLG